MTINSNAENRKESNSRYYQKNKDILKAKNRERWGKNRDRYLLTAKKSRHKRIVNLKKNPPPATTLKMCTDCKKIMILDKFSKHNNGEYGRYNSCKNCRNKKRRERWAVDIEHRSRVTKRNAKFDSGNIQARRSRNRKYQQEHKKEGLERSRRFELRHKNEPSFIVRKSIKRRIYNAVKNKKGHTIDIVGCDIETLIAHIESQFQQGMVWENYGSDGWHIDHISPCSQFDLSQQEEVNKCFHYTNLQPLWAADNISKSDKPCYFLRDIKQGMLSV